MNDLNLNTSTNTNVKFSEDSLNEGKYNARDVLTTCRIYPFLVEAVERTRTAGVYETDVQMAHLALQMTRVGMPVSASERERVGAHLRQLRDAAAYELQSAMESSWDNFLRGVACLQAAKVRKGEPVAGTIQESGAVHSAESSFAVRVELRKEAFIKKIEKNGWSKKGLNLGAKIQQAALLRAVGVPLLKVTEKTGLPKIDKEVLEDMRQYPVAKALLSWTLTSAALRNFVENLALDENGWLHPEWEIHKITGRWGSKPNVQNWSKRAGGGVENLRKMIVAPDGYVFVGADQRQLEARLIAADSSDPFLVGVFQRGEDIHGAMAGVAFPNAWPKAAEVYKAHKKQDCGPSTEERKCDACKLRDKLRDLAKRLEYGAFYGGSDETLHSSVVKDFPELKRSEVQTFLANVSKTMPRVITWRAGLLEQAIKEGEISSPILGRRQIFPMGRVEPTVVYNFRPQSGGADLWALGAIEFCQRWDQTAFDARIVHNGHDSILILTREDLVDRVSNDICESWERKWNGVDFLMDVKIGKSWADT